MSEQRRAAVFRYESWTLDPETWRLTCTYSLDGRTFTELVTFDPSPAITSSAVRAAARLVFLLAGISYYKAGAPPVIDLGEHAVTDRERQFLLRYYIDGLGEFAFKNGLLAELQELRIEGPTLAAPEPAEVPRSDRPLVPFGGGIDSIVVVESVRQGHPDAALFVASRAEARFEAIESAAAVTGLPIRRADREIDEQVLRSRELGFLNGHVPVTGILSAMAITAALLDGRDAVVMSNEWSASSGTTISDGIPVNHQWSKSEQFEEAFRGLLAESLPGFEYFSALRAWSELWVARRFADLHAYHPVFRSCNRAFHLDPALRWDHWCGRCDKCCFIDLILSPFLERSELESIFRGAEPLAQADLEPKFLALLGDPLHNKPFECVGDENECRTAVLLAAARDDRADTALLQQLAELVRGAGAPPSAEELLRPLGRSFVPDGYGEPDLIS